MLDKYFIHAVRRAALLCAMLLVALLAAAQDVIRVTGTVTSKLDKEPLIGVNVTDVPTKRTLASTDIDGKFSINVLSNTTLRFSMIGAKTQEVKVKGQKTLNIVLDEDDITLGEITVATKRITDKIMPEQTDIEIRGNYFHVRTRVRVPREMFSHNTRLVVQPTLRDVTRGEEMLMRPLVYDAREYHRTQDRLYDFNMADSTAGDPLARYVTVKSPSLREKGRTNDIIGYNDSIYVEHVKDEYACNVYMAIENYNRILYRDTTVIAKGTVNPLRWLDYNFAAKPVADARFFPKPEVQLRDSRGEVNLVFPVGKSRLDISDPQNAAEIEKLRRQVEAIADQKDASLQSLSMEGQASPEGSYQNNLSLAQKRMESALGYLRQQMPERLRQNATFKSKASVAPWADVAKLMRADGRTDEAAQVEAAIGRFNSFEAQTRAVRRLPFYRGLIDTKYLPRLRRVGYEMHYAIYRELTIDEIRQLYNDDYKQLSRFEFFTLYRSVADEAEREKILRQAIEVYPKFMVAANDLAAILINRHQSDPDLLRPFAGDRAPQEVNVNQMIALLDAGLYHDADSVAEFVENNEQTRTLHAVNAVLNGRYDDNFAVIANTGTRNELLMLLAMKRNEEALKLSKQLDTDEALSHYLRAICLNRTENPSEAYDELKKSFEMDPKLREMAPLDGDVNDLLDLEKKN